MRKIVIFGATGNIGAYFTDYCKNAPMLKNFEIIAVGRRDTDFFDKNGITYVKVDINNPKDFHKLPKDDVYAVVNLAGKLPAYSSSNDPFGYIDINITGGMRILEYARRSGADRILYTQTWAELAGFWGKETVLSPDMPRNLVYQGDHAFYSITKCMMVDALEYYKQEFGLKNFVFRLPNVYLYAPQQYYFVNGEKKLIAYRYMIERAVRGDNLEIWGDPNAFKDIIYVKDLCNMMCCALVAGCNGGVFHAGTGVKTTLREQIEGITEVFCPRGHKSMVIEKPDKPSFTSFVMDIKNAERELGYKPEYDYISYLKDYKKEREMKRFDELWASKVDCN